MKPQESESLRTHRRSDNGAVDIDYYRSWIRHIRAEAAREALRQLARGTVWLFHKMTGRDRERSGVTTISAVMRQGFTPAARSWQRHYRALQRITTTGTTTTK